MKILLVAAACVALNPTVSASADATSGTVSLLLDGDRIYAELTFVRPNGVRRPVWAFVDLGGPSMLVSEELLQELVFHEMELTELVWKKCEEFVTGACMHDEVGIDAAPSQQAKVVVRQNGLAAEARRGVLGDDEHAHVILPRRRDSSLTCAACLLRLVRVRSGLA